jgi:hypothetical protein
VTPEDLSFPLPKKGMEFFISWQVINF